MIETYIAGQGLASIFDGMKGPTTMTPLPESPKPVWFRHNDTLTIKHAKRTHLVFKGDKRFEPLLEVIEKELWDVLPVMLDPNSAYWQVRGMLFDDHNAGTTTYYEGTRP